MSGGIFVGVLGAAVSLISIIGVIVKVCMDYAQVKGSVSRIEEKVNDEFSKIKEDIQKETKDIREDFSKDIKTLESSYKQDVSSIQNDIKNLEQTHLKEIDRIKDEMAKDRAYTHESFVKITKDQQEMSDTLKEVSLILKSFETNIGQRLTSLEHKIDSITTVKVVDNA